MPSTHLFHFTLVIIYSIILITLSFVKETLSFSTKSLSSSHLEIKPIQQISSNHFDPYKHYFHNNQTTYHETPVLIKNVVSPNECESICNALFEYSSNYYVDLQCKKKHAKRTKTDIVQCTLYDAFDYMMESTHTKSYFSFCEGLLDDSTTNEEIKAIENKLHESKEKVFSKYDGTRDNLFQYFPYSVKPTDCIILAGEGATSTLHRDPFEWTGTSICLEGSKIWRFISPPGLYDDGSGGVKDIDDMLNSYKLPSVAWQNDNTDDTDYPYLSAGYQSDLSLYEHRDDKVPSAQQFAYMEEDMQNKYATLESIAQDINALRPNPKIMKQLSNKKYTIHSVVQEAGDLLIIPAYWYHQTYACEPSLALASQRCAVDRDMSRVIKHILRNALGYDDVQCNEYILDGKGENPRNFINKVFDHLNTEIDI